MRPRLHNTQLEMSTCRGVMRPPTCIFLPESSKHATYRNYNTITYGMDIKALVSVHQERCRSLAVHIGHVLDILQQNARMPFLARKIAWKTYDGELSDHIGWSSLHGKKRVMHPTSREVIGQRCQGEWYEKVDEHGSG
jgi:hypothetical protein